MATYTADSRTLVRTDGDWNPPIHGGNVAEVATASMAAWSTVTRPARTGWYTLPALKYVLNRGRNTGGGAAFMYWLSPDKADPTGLHYPYESTVPFAQLTDIIPAGVTYPTSPW